MTWSEFKTIVDNLLVVDADRLGPVSTAKDQWVKQAVIDIQKDIPFYRGGHEKIFGVQDFVVEQNASKGIIPDSAHIREMFWTSTTFACSRIPLRAYGWGNRFDLICGAMQPNQYAVSLDPHGRRFYIYPKVIDGYQVSMFYDGVKSDFADAEEVPFDEQVAEAVSEYVSGKIARRIDHDHVLHSSYMTSYKKQKGSIYVDAKERQRIMLAAESPQSGWCTCPPNPENEDNIEFVAFGDFGDGSANETAVAELAKSFEPDFMVWLGDCNYPSGAPETIEANIMDDFDGYVPGGVYPVWGNHDLLTSLDGQYGKPLLDLFPSLSQASNGKLYYDFVRGPVHFFVLNSGNTDADPREPGGIQYFTDSNGVVTGGDQALWFKEAIEASTATWKVVCCHRPPYTSDSTHYPGSTAMRWPFKQCGADIVLSGHGHVYERIYKSGLTYVVCGLGGAAKRDFSSYPVSGSQFQYNSDYGLLRVTASDTRMQFVMYNTVGDRIDNFSLYKSDTVSTIYSNSFQQQEEGDDVDGWFQVEGLTELKAISNASTNRFACIDYLNVAGDGLGGLYTWNNTVSGAGYEDDVNWVKPSDTETAQAGRWERHISS